MNKFLFAITLICAVMLLSVPVDAQRQSGADYVSHPFDKDTIVNSTGVTFTLSNTLKIPNSISAAINADSLSGSTAGFIFWEVAYVDSPGADDWITAETDTINGVTGDHTYINTNSNARRIRARCTGGGTQSTELTCSIAVVQLE